VNRRMPLDHIQALGNPLLCVHGIQQMVRLTKGERAHEIRKLLPKLLQADTLKSARLTQFNCYTRTCVFASCASIQSRLGRARHDAPCSFKSAPPPTRSLELGFPLRTNHSTHICRGVGGAQSLSGV
jgi:hypothetical protein